MAITTNLIAWNKNRNENLTVTRVVKNFRFFQGNRQFIAVYINLWNIKTWASCIQHISALSVTNICIILPYNLMILGKQPTWRTILFYVFIYIFNSLHVSSTSCWSSGETNCVNTTSGSCHSVSVAVSCAGREVHLRPAHDTATDSYQRLYWHNLSFLMTSKMCSKDVG